MKSFTVTSNEENQRFDKYLKRLLPNAGSGFLYKMLRKKNIVLNGKKADGTEVIHAGDEIKVFFSDETLEKFMGKTEIIQNDIPDYCTLPMSGIQVIYEDDDILIVNKPINMLSQKAKPTDISANEILLGYLMREGKISQESLRMFKPSVCNRLDRNTTGLLLMGKTLHGAQTLSEGLKKRTIQKYYRAVVHGHLADSISLHGYLKKDSAINKVSLLPDNPEHDPDLVPIHTDIRPLSYKNGCTVVEVHLITGKTHQIRAHLASIGHPIIGDPKYGNEAINEEYRKNYRVKCQMLHAFRVEMPDGRIFVAPLPNNYNPFIDC